MRMGRLVIDDRKETVTQITTRYNQGTLKKMIFALCSISLIKMSSYNITLGKNGPNLILLNINNVIYKQLGLHVLF